MIEEKDARLLNLKKMIEEKDAGILNLKNEINKPHSQGIISALIGRLAFPLFMFVVIFLVVIVLMGNADYNRRAFSAFVGMWPLFKGVVIQTLINLQIM
tara:strand:+ start:2208 stop:2504 length:297 start_codon:yes stop_codon:yes gene_type:complete